MTTWRERGGVDAEPGLTKLGKWDLWTEQQLIKALRFWRRCLSGEVCLKASRCLHVTETVGSIPCLCERPSCIIGLGYGRVFKLHRPRSPNRAEVNSSFLCQSLATPTVFPRCQLQIASSKRKRDIQVLASCSVMRDDVDVHGAAVAVWCGYKGRS